MAFGNDTIKGLRSLLASEPDPQDEAFWREVRSKFLCTDEWICMNNAGLSPSPRVAHDAMRAQMERGAVNPSMVVYRQQARQLEPIRARLSQLIGCSAENLALVPNATYGLHTGIMGSSVSSESRIVHSAHEYPRAKAAVAQRKKRTGVDSMELSVPDRPADLASMLPDRIGLAVMSSLTFINGSVLPVREIGELVRKQGGLTLVDGAQAVGILPQDIGVLNCDMYAACLHKWVMGPVGTGIFFVRPGLAEKIYALHPEEPDEGSKITKFEHFGTHAIAPFLALAEALDFHEMLGQNAKLARVRYLRQTMVNSLEGYPKVVLNGREGFEGTDVVLTVGITGMSGGQLAAQLLSDYRIHGSPEDVDGVHGVRLSPTVFTTRVECESAASAIRALADRL